MQTDRLLELAHQLGREERKLAILGEGNVSCRLSPEELCVKASGSSLATLRDEDLTACHAAPLLALLDRKRLSDTEIEQSLLQSRSVDTARKPSTETVFHAWLLTLEGVSFVGHCHPVTANQVLCSPRARDFAESRSGV